MKGNKSKCLSRALVQVRVQVETLFGIVLIFRCASLNAMSYHAESFVIELDGTEGKEELEGLAHGE